MRQKGFTLIELLIVISIIGVLAAVLVPNLLSARDRSHDVAALSCAKELITQAEFYIIDHDSYEGFDGTGPYEARSCGGETINNFTVDITTVTNVEGTVTSLTGRVFSFGNSMGVSSQ